MNKEDQAKWEDECKDFTRCEQTYTVANPKGIELALTKDGKKLISITYHNGVYKKPSEEEIARLVADTLTDPVLTMFIIGIDKGTSRLNETELNKLEAKAKENPEILKAISTLIRLASK